jgi:hypothetical protein
MVARYQARRTLRLFVSLAYALVLGMWCWQTALIEVVDAHDASAECEDDGEGGPCDCGDNCHCCIACSHGGISALPIEVVAAPEESLMAFVLLPAPALERVPLSRDEGPPIKVPKPVA